MGKVAIKYTLIFDPSESWSRYYEFEQDLTSFFGERGLALEIVEVPEGQKADSRILLVNKKEGIEISEPVKTNRQIRADASKNRDFDGKFKKQNG
jgi:hypothetical protein